MQGADGNFYGATVQGGAHGEGTLFSITTNGTITTLLSFAGTNGSSPSTGLVQATDGNFYGTRRHTAVWGTTVFIGVVTA